MRSSPRKMYALLFFSLAPASGGLRGAGDDGEVSVGDPENLYGLPYTPTAREDTSHLELTLLRHFPKRLSPFDYATVVRPDLPLAQQCDLSGVAATTSLTERTKTCAAYLDAQLQIGGASSDLIPKAHTELAGAWAKHAFHDFTKEKDGAAAPVDRILFTSTIPRAVETGDLLAAEAGAKQASVRKFSSRLFAEEQDFPDASGVCVSVYAAPFAARKAKLIDNKRRDGFETKLLDRIWENAKLAATQLQPILTDELQRVLIEDDAASKHAGVGVQDAAAGSGTTSGTSADELSFVQKDPAQRSSSFLEIFRTAEAHGRAGDAAVKESEAAPTAEEGTADPRPAQQVLDYATRMCKIAQFLQVQEIQSPTAGNELRAIRKKAESDGNIVGSLLDTAMQVCESLFDLVRRYDVQTFRRSMLGAALFFTAEFVGGAKREVVQKGLLEASLASPCAKDEVGSRTQDDIADIVSAPNKEDAEGTKTVRQVVTVMHDANLAGLTGFFATGQGWVESSPFAQEAKYAKDYRAEFPMVVKLRETSPELEPFCPASYGAALKFDVASGPFPPFLWGYRGPTTQELRDAQPPEVLQADDEYYFFQSSAEMGQVLGNVVPSLSNGNDFHRPKTSFPRKLHALKVRLQYLLTDWTAESEAEKKWIAVCQTAFDQLFPEGIHCPFC
ncbi:unnamed protein product [Amoebophrya sp. A120]|nr:unnamed protein product [Amoebophrya sp. A120]|eukprot:GSA120T00006252001.1